MTQTGLYYQGADLYRERPGDIVKAMKGLKPEDQQELLEGYSDAAVDHYFEALRKDFNKFSPGTRALIMNDITDLMETFNKELK